jgi:transposase
MHGRGMSIRQIAGKLGVSRSVAHKAINATPNGVR